MHSCTGFHIMPLATTAQPVKLLDRLRHACRVRHYSIRTEDAYHDWAKRFILFHGKRHPLDMSEPDVNAFKLGYRVQWDGRFGQRR